MSDPLAALHALPRQHAYLVGVDSDGCAFDTMALKHKACFIPNLITFWGLQRIAALTRETAEFTALYSQHRGTNRWRALVLTLDMLCMRPAVQQRAVVVPTVPALRAFTEQAQFPLSADGLRAFMQTRPPADHPELNNALAWSAAVDAAVAARVHGTPIFPYVRRSLTALQSHADILVVSTTPASALEREWRAHDMRHLVQAVGGQEMGSKAAILSAAADGAYAPGHMLMIGDSPGDYRAAQQVGALFYPILAGAEAASWRTFYEDGLPRFLTGRFSARYQAQLSTAFQTHLPAEPPWMI